MCGEGAENLTEQAQHIADYALAALAPIIAAEIRAWAEGERDAYLPDFTFGGQLDRARTGGRLAQLELIDRDAPAIASRICGGGEAQFGQPTPNTCQSSIGGYQ
jgi:hypothetical protein